MTLSKQKITKRLFWLVLGLSLLLHDETLGPIDIQRRFQTTRSFWLNVPAVLPYDANAYTALIGSNGQFYYWWGMGQSIIMLPGDIVANFITGITQSPTSGLLEHLITSTLTFPLISAAGITISFLLLTELEFNLFQALMGALTLLFCTTFLHYTQVPQENSQIIFLVLTAYYMHLQWFKYNKLIWLIIGSGSLAFLLVMRLTVTADIIGESIFIGLLLLQSAKHAGKFNSVWRRLTKFVFAQTLSVSVFFLLDRLYQYKRFGDFTSTYLDVMARQIKNGTLNTTDFLSPVRGAVTPGWPWDLSRLQGVANFLFSPEKSIFLYDPILIVLILVVGVRQFKLERVNTNFNFRGFFLLATVIGLVIYIYGYSNFLYWSGDWAWGARYIVTSVQEVCLLAVPLFLESLPRLNKVITRLFYTLIGYALFIQFLSILLTFDLEVAQQECGIGLNLRVLQRLINLWNIVTGGALDSPECSLVASQYNRFTFWPFLTNNSFTPFAHIFFTGVFLVSTVTIALQMVKLISQTNKLAKSDFSFNSTVENLSPVQLN